MAFQGRVALVTGGASGMGRITAERLLAAGAQVAILDLNEAALAEFAGSHPGLHPFRCDTADLQQVQDVIGRVEDSLGPIDRLVHCAAIMPTFPLLEHAPAQILRVMNINYGGTVAVTQAMLPRMLARGRGELVVYGSLAGHVLTERLGAYNASKAATNAYMEVLIHESRGKGVHILLVNPPMVNTPLIQQALDTSSPRSIRDSHASGRMADPGFIVTEAEKALERGDEIVFPGMEAKLLHWWRRLAPGLLWKVIDKANR